LLLLILLQRFSFSLVVLLKADLAK